jgi:antitoxin ParD1/3/4
MTVEIPAELEQYLRQELSKGEYRSEGELILDAVRVLRELKARHEGLRQDIHAAIAQSDRGESEPLDIEAIRAEGRERLTGQSKES